MCLRGALCSIFFNLTYNMTTFNKKTKQEMCHNVANATKDEDISMLRSEVKVTVIQKRCNPKMYSHTKFGIPTSNIFFYKTLQVLPHIEMLEKLHVF